MHIWDRTLPSMWPLPNPKHDTDKSCAARILFDHRTRMVIDADPLAASDGARTPRPPAASDDPSVAASLFDVVHGTALADVAAGTAPWWRSHPPHYAASTTATSSSAYAAAAAASSSTSPPPPPLQSHGDNLACYAGSIMDTLFLQPPSMAELSYLCHPQPQGFPLPPCFAAPIALEPATATTIRPELQFLTTMTPPASVPPPSLYPQTRGTTTAPAHADTQQAQEEGTRPTARRRGRPSKRAPTVSEPPVSKPTKRVAVGIGSNRAASASQRTSTSGRQQTAATCTSTNRPMAALLCEERRCQLQRPAFSNGGAPAAGVVVEGHHQQQAAIAPPPEPTMATGPPSYADTSAVGVRFHPSDQQLIDYLRMKYAGQEMPVKLFKEFDVYQAHPMAIKGACGESQDGCWYAFSPRDRRYRNGRRPARSVFAEGGGEQVGFWKSNSKLGEVRAGGSKDGAVIGRMTSLTFHVGRQPKGTQTGWKMKEYTIPENQHQPDGSAMLVSKTARHTSYIAS